MKQQKIRIKKFDPRQIPDGSVCTFIGKRKSGKSVTIKDIMWHKRHIPIGQVISSSEEVNPFFSDFFPSSYIEPKYSPQLIDNIFQRQRKIKKMAHDPKYKGARRKIDSRFMLVFDDCLHDHKWQNTEQIRTIFMNGRHYDIFFILSLQYVIGVPPNLRTNIDYAFIFRDTSLQNRKKIYQNFGAAIPTFEMFNTLMKNLKQYECIVLCNDGDKVNFEDQVMFYKATLHDEFRFGGNEFWDQDRQIKSIKEKYKVKQKEDHNDTMLVTYHGN